MPVIHQIQTKEQPNIQILLLVIFFPDSYYKFDKENHPSIGDICYLLGRYDRENHRTVPIDISESDLNNHIRKEITEEGKSIYYFGKYKLENDKEIRCNESNEYGGILCITKVENINRKESTIKINEKDVNGEIIKHFKRYQTLYLELLYDNIPYNYKVKIKTYENEIIHFTPSIPRYCEISNIFIIPNPVNHMKMLKQVDSSKYIYKLSGFSDNL